MIVSINSPQEALALPHGVIRINFEKYAYTLNIPTQRVSQKSIYLAARHILRKSQKPIISSPYSRYSEIPLTRADILADAINEYGYCRDAPWRGIRIDGGWKVYDVLRRVDREDLESRGLGGFPVNHTCTFLPRKVLVARKLAA